MSIRTTTLPSNLPAAPATTPGPPERPAPMRAREGMTVLHSMGRPDLSKISQSLASSTEALANSKSLAADAISAKQLSPDGSVRDAGSMARRARSERPHLPAMQAVQQAIGNNPAATSTAAQTRATATPTNSVSGTAKKTFQLELTGPIDKATAHRFIAQEVANTPLDQAPNNVIGSFLRNDSDATRALKRLLSSELASSAQHLIESMVTRFEKDLQKAGNTVTRTQIDQFMGNMFKEAINDLNKVPLSGNFTETVLMIGDTLTTAADRHCADAPPEKHAQIRKTADECRQGIVKAIMLRTLTVEMNDYVRAAKSPHVRNAGQLTQVAGSRLAPG